MLIYNWKPAYTGRQESGEEEQDFQQTYIFDGAGAGRQQAKGAGSLLYRWLSWA